MSQSGMKNIADTGPQWCRKLGLRDNCELFDWTFLLVKYRSVSAFPSRLERTRAENPLYSQRALHT